MADAVNHPSHYNAYKGIEVIDITEQMNFNLGNAVKCVARAGLKDKDTEIEDLEKAKWYVNREIERGAGYSENNLEFSDLEKLVSQMVYNRGLAVWHLAGAGRIGNGFYKDLTFAVEHISLEMARMAAIRDEELGEVRTQLMGEGDLRIVAQADPPPWKDGHENITAKPISKWMQELGPELVEVSAGRSSLSAGYAQAISGGMFDAHRNYQRGSLNDTLITWEKVTDLIDQRVPWERVRDFVGSYRHDTCANNCPFDLERSDSKDKLDLERATKKAEILEGEVEKAIAELPQKFVPREEAVRMFLVAPHNAVEAHMRDECGPNCKLPPHNMIIVD